MKLESYRDLVAWQKALDLCEAIYQTSSHFPRHELYGLTSQIRRAAVSVPSNIAEGAGRITQGEFVQAVGYARGSLFEIETQVHIAERWRFINSEESARLFERTKEVWTPYRRINPRVIE